MIWPSDETLESAAHAVSGALVSAEALDRVKAILGSLPDAFAAHYLECRLAARTDRIDFLTCAFAANGGRQILAEQGTVPAQLACQQAHPAWQQVQRFLALWSDPTSPLYHQVPLVWLEFDRVLEPVPRFPPPCFHFCLDRDYLQTYTQLRSTYPIQQSTRQQLAEVGLHCLLDRPLSRHSQQQLAACFDQLPAGCTIPHLSTMLARQPAALKVNVQVGAGVPDKQVLAYLQQVGWSGSLAQAETALLTFRAADTALIVDFAVGESVDPILGLAFSQATASTQLAEDVRLLALLDQIVASGLCPAEKQAALLAWPGATRVKYRRYARPALLQRWVDVKLVCHADGTIEAKAYLGFMPRSSLF